MLPDKFPIVSWVLAANNAQNNIYEMNCYQMHLDVEKVEHNLFRFALRSNV